MTNPADLPPASTPSSSVYSSKAIAFVDCSLSDYTTLISGLNPGTEVHLLNSAQDEIAQIDRVLANSRNLDAVIFLGHGESGGLLLGDELLTAQNLAGYADDLRGWSQALAPGTDLLFYGCNVAAGEAGQTLLRQIHQLTGADVAASDDLTGGALGGDWELEAQIGSIDSANLLQVDPTTAYPYLLDRPSDEDNAALGQLVLQAVRQAKFDQVVDFGPVEDLFSQTPAPRIAHMPNVDVAVIELDEEGNAKAVANVLLSRDYRKGLTVSVDDNFAAESVRWRKWDIDRWNGGTFADDGTKLTNKGWKTNPTFTKADDIVRGQQNARNQFMSPYPASLFKILVAYYVMQLVDDGTLSLDQRYTYSETGETRRIRGWMNPMITYSDNNATRALVKLLHDRDQIKAMNAEFRSLGLGTLQINGTDPTTGGNWQPGKIHMTALDTARLFWLIEGNQDEDQQLWERPNGDAVTSEELSDSSRRYLKRLLANQGFNEVLSTSNFGTYRANGKLKGTPNTRPGIPAIVPNRWIDPQDGTVTVDGIPYGQDVRPFNRRAAQVRFAHKTGLTLNYGSDAGIVESLPGQPYRHYVIAFLANLGYRYADPVFADRTSYPYTDPVGGIAYTQRIPALGKQIDDGIKAANDD
ncbi:MAG: DUF4347 domain-containing protein [Elainella sp.]